MRLSNEIGESVFTVKVDQSRGCHCRCGNATLWYCHDHYDHKKKLIHQLISIIHNLISIHKRATVDCNGGDCKRPEGPKPPERGPGGPIKVVVVVVVGGGGGGGPQVVENHFQGRERTSYPTSLFLSCSWLRLVAYISPKHDPPDNI